MNTRAARAALFAVIIACGTGVGAQKAADSPAVADEARRLRLPILLSLPASLGGQAFRLRRVLRTGTSSGGTLEATGHSAQALYVGGEKTLSVFVSDVTQTPDARLAPPSAKGDWKPLRLADGRIAFMHTTLHKPHSAVVWVGGGHRYTAIARLPLSHLAPLARALARSNTLTIAALPTADNP